MKHPIIKSILFLALILVGYQIVLGYVLAADDVIGRIKVPEMIRTGYGTFDSPRGGIIGFASNLIMLVMVLAGIWSLLNIIFAGFNYITQSTNPEAIANANKQIYMSLLGLVIIVGSFALAGILGYLLFGDASAILSPIIYGPGSQGTPPA